MQIESFIYQQTNIPIHKINATLKLLDDGATIPFIARYRKEATGQLDEVEIAEIKDQKNTFETLISRKETILKSIEEQGKLTDALKDRIDDCFDTLVLEDIYLPYKRKRKTRADKAREKGLEPFAEMLWKQESFDLKAAVKPFLSEEVLDLDDAIEGAKDIMAEWINQDEQVRNLVRNSFKKAAILTSTLKAGKEKEAIKYADYFNFQTELKSCPSHTYLAIRRGESEGLLSVSLEPPVEITLPRLENHLLAKGISNPSRQLVKESIEEAYKRLLYPSIENEYHKLTKEKADADAIQVFVTNLKQLLLAAPLGSKSTLAIDPGYRTGCKVVVLNINGDFVEETVIYPHPPQQKANESLMVLQALIDKHDIHAVAVGNGTAGKETMSLCQQLNGVEVYMVNEAGASIYSASEVAREEFPSFDLTVRGAISIGRRLMDPLAELVKLPAKSIGVGQYQHDVDQVKLKESLDRAVESCVNQVGINVNTASRHLLTYVAGLGPTLAANIVSYRSQYGNFKERKELLKVPRMGQKAFEQCAGFLRIKNGANPLDNTAVHPERYRIVEKMATSTGLSMTEFVGNEAAITKISLTKYQEDVGAITLKDIIKELKKPGLDARGKARAFHFAQHINSIEDLTVGMTLPGIVTNITKFGAFVDVGVKQDGLVHVSEIANQFVDDPHKFLKINQELKVKVVGLDLAKNRVQLSIKQA